MTPRERLGRVLHGGEAGDPTAPLKALEAAGVRQVLIGALARTLRGTDESWLAVEICPDMDPPNAALLESVLSQLPAGAVHVCATPTGSGGYDDLTRAATAEAIAARLCVFVASVDDLVRIEESKSEDRNYRCVRLLRRLSDIPPNPRPIRP